ncbi:MAG: hypothetical protein A3F14_02960 [Gammaproteobacteria bacterium RIFCSPHIGHO2_12_FULL_43_28]|nr:MAG: hypothetical protein A3F14_02960 [Gammaproteobacteria bacterium RIFCSPHIGHO2_12_FULL_43_28]
MTKEQGQFDFNTNWYELWMNQSNQFFETANDKLKDLFGKNKFVNPEDHLQQINEWMEKLKSQWEGNRLTPDQRAFESYWKTMSKMCSDATELMLNQWIKRSREDNPIKTVRELYELWLSSCNEVYQRSLQSKAFQDAYGEFMQSAFKYWKLAAAK